MFQKLILLLLFFCSINAFAKKSDSIKPKWLTSKELPKSKSGDYCFVYGYGEGATLEEARQAAMLNMTTKLESEYGFIIDSERIVTTHVEKQQKRNSVSTKSSKRTDFSMTIKVDGREVNIICQTIDEYWESNSSGYSVYVLYTVPFPWRGILGVEDEIYCTSNYGATGFLSVIPGLGQYVKGSSFKGSMFLGLEITSAAVIIVAENNRASYKNKMVEQPKFAKQYQEKADRSETTRNIAIGAAGAIYLWNLIDAFATKGARKVIVKSKNSSLSIAPRATLDDVGFSLTYNF